MSWVLYHKQIGVLEQMCGLKVQLSQKVIKRRTSVSIMFQLPPQIVLGRSNSNWYLHIVFHPLNTSCKNREPIRREPDVTAFYMKLYQIHHGRSLPTDVLTTDFFITELRQLHLSIAIGFSGLSYLVCLESLIVT